MIALLAILNMLLAPATKLASRARSIRNSRHATGMARGPSTTRLAVVTGLAIGSIWAVGGVYGALLWGFGALMISSLGRVMDGQLDLSEIRDRTEEGFVRGGRRAILRRSVGQVVCHLATFRR